MIQAHVSSPTSGTAAVHTLLTRLTAAGWRVRAWSDATTLTSGTNLTSNPYGSASSGAGNLGNTSAWFRVAAPDLSREWLFQRGSADQTWTISRSVAGFTGGSPSATTAGTATDATALFSNAVAFPTSQWRQFVSIEDAAPYGFAVFGIVLGGGDVLQFLVDEPLASSTYDTSDTDPYIWWAYNSGGASGLAGATGGIQARLSSNLNKRFTGAGSNQSSQLMSYYSPSAGFVAPATSATTAQVGLTPNTLREAILPIHAIRPIVSSNVTGWIGTLNRLRAGTVGGRANGQTLGPVSGAYWIFMAGIWVPWDSTEPALS